MKQKEFHTNGLIKSRSVEHERPHLCHLKAMQGFMATTDGHRMFATTHLYHPAHEGKSFNGEIFAETEALVETKEGPKWKFEELIPHKVPCTHVISWQVPRAIGMLKNSRASDMPIAIVKSGENYSVNLSGCFDESVAIVHLNAKLLAQLAGQCVLIGVRDSLTAVVIVPAGGLVDRPMESEWFAVIMPMRYDLEPVGNELH